MGVLKGLAKMAVRTAVSSAAKGAAKQIFSGPSETTEQKKTFVRNGIRCIEDPYGFMHDGLECKLMSVNNNGRAIVGKGRVVNTGRGVFSNITVDVEYRLSDNEVICSKKAERCVLARLLRSALLPAAAPEMLMPYVWVFRVMMADPIAPYPRSV